MRVAAAVALILAIAAVIIRQPVFFPLPFPGRAHADPASLRRHVEQFAGGRTAAPNLIAASFRASGAHVTEQLFTARGTGARNIIATFGKPSRELPLTVVGAHYDAFNGLPGADDNASGTAGLLELARLLGRSPAPAGEVVLVAYANEEPPFFGSADMGSAVHAASLGRREVRMICLEMIGYYTERQPWHSVVMELLFPSRGDFIAVAGGWHDRGLIRLVKRAMTGAGMEVAGATLPHSMLDASDQRNYWSHGWPAVMVGDTAYIRNPNYHTRRDTAETLDYSRMARVVDGLYGAALSLAGER